MIPEEMDIELPTFYTKDVKQLQEKSSRSFLSVVQKLSKNIEKRPTKYKFMSLSQFFAKRLLDPITKSEVVIGLDAQKGAGKSVSSLRLAEDVSKELSFMTYGDYDHTLEFFNPETNIAIITDESIHNILKNLLKEHQVLILDDAGNSIGNRDAQTRSNKLIVKLMQTIRIKSCCFIISCPSLMMVDKQLRDLCTHHMHVEESFHEEGFNMLSCKRIWQSPSGQKKEIHLTAADCGSKELGARSILITRWKIGKPSKKVNKMYDKLRLELTEQQIRDTNAMLQKERENIAEEYGLPLETNKSLAKKAEEAKAVEWAQKVLAGEESQRGAEAQSGISRFKIAKAMNKIISANGGKNPFKEGEET